MQWFFPLSYGGLGISLTEFRGLSFEEMNDLNQKMREQKEKEDAAVAKMRNKRTRGGRK